MGGLVAETGIIARLSSVEVGVGAGAELGDKLYGLVLLWIGLVYFDMLEWYFSGWVECLGGWRN